MALAAGQYDQLVVSGGVSLGNAVLSGVLGYTPAVGDSYVIVNKTGGGAVNGTLQGLAEGSFVTLGGQSFRVRYTGGDGNDVTLTRENPSSPPTTYSHFLPVIQR